MPGYKTLIDRYALQVIPPCHESIIGTTRKVHIEQGRVVEYFPAAYAPGEEVGEQLEFALKYDGVDLGVLAALFRAVDVTEVTEYVTRRPTGKYARKVWFLYEYLTGQTLPLDDLPAVGNYIDVLESQLYYTAPAVRVRRQRINDNLLGVREFCPIVRRTAALEKLEQADPAVQCRAVIQDYPADVLRRALSFLYTKETKSSFEIERQTPDPTRTERFVALLRNAEHEEFATRHGLIDLQHRTVDERFKDTDYRTTQNYVGQTVAWREKIHYVPPQPGDLPPLMAGLLAAHERLSASDVDAVVHAAVLSFGFVFLHPFEDGNGRIHRFLIHHVLARRGVTPAGFIFPVSAAMLRDRAAYDECLEKFSRPLMQLVAYALDEGGQMTVEGETADYYRYLDLTAQTEVLAEFIQRTIDSELPGELEFLKNYDRVKAGIQEVADMPDRLIDRFIDFCLQNNGRLSARKRKAYFELLSDDEVRRMEEAVVRGRLGV